MLNSWTWMSKFTMKCTLQDVCATERTAWHWQAWHASVDVQSTTRFRSQGHSGTGCVQYTLQSDFDEKFQYRCYSTWHRVLSSYGIQTSLDGMERAQCISFRYWCGHCFASPWWNLCCQGLESNGLRSGHYSMCVWMPGVLPGNCQRAVIFAYHTKTMSFMLLKMHSAQHSCWQALSDVLKLPLGCIE